eukprot:40757-Prorocentrum_lima.AAC.1
MTSSLVGSEMCIRDSHKKVSEAMLAELKRRQDLNCFRRSSRSEYKNRVDAVSYTHLTLPTICSV